MGTDRVRKGVAVGGIPVPLDLSFDWMLYFSQS